MQAIHNLDAPAVNRLLAENTAMLVDVREAGEYAREHIAGAKLMPLSQMDAASLPRDQPLVLCCASGIRSQTAARKLLQAGFTVVAHLHGGLAAWKAAGLPTQAGIASQAA
jgi:rhodanese-related sulfurtransferase